MLESLGGSLQVFELWQQHQYEHATSSPPQQYEFLQPVFTSIAAILFDFNCRLDPEAVRAFASHPSPPPQHPNCADNPLVFRNPLLPSLIEHMLLVDYGLGEHPLHRPWYILPSTSREKWRPALYRLAAEFTDLAVHCATCTARPVAPVKWTALNNYIHHNVECAHLGDPADIALALHHFHTHRRAITADEHRAGLTGYTGVLERMVIEANTGSDAARDRLLRKLAVDVLLMRRFIRSSRRRVRMRAVAAELVRAQGGFGPRRRTSKRPLPPLPRAPANSSVSSLPSSSSSSGWSSATLVME